MWGRCGLSWADDAYLSWPQQPVAEPVTRLDHPGHPLIGGIRVCVEEERLVADGIERLPLDADAIDDKLAHHARQAMTGQSDTSRPWVRRQIVWYLRERAVELVQQRQERANHIGLGGFADLRPLTFDAALVVQEISPLSLEQSEQLVGRAEGR